jgi:hypothetical protein
MYMFKQLNISQFVIVFQLSPSKSFINIHIHFYYVLIHFYIFNSSHLGFILRSDVRRESTRPPQC